MERTYAFGSGEQQVHANRWLQDIMGLHWNVESHELQTGDAVLAKSVGEYLLKSGQPALKATFDVLSHATFGIGSAAAANSFVAEAAELALLNHIGQSEAGGTASAFVAIDGAVSIDPALLGPEDDPIEHIGVELLKTGIKFDIVGSLDEVNDPPAALDSYQPARVYVAADGSSNQAVQGSTGDDLWIAVQSAGILRGLRATTSLTAVAALIFSKVEPIMTRYLVGLAVTA